MSRLEQLVGVLSSLFINTYGTTNFALFAFSGKVIDLSISGSGSMLLELGKSNAVRVWLRAAGQTQNSEYNVLHFF